MYFTGCTKVHIHSPSSQDFKARTVSSTNSFTFFYKIFNFSELEFVSCLGQPKRIKKKNTFQATTSGAEENSRTFQGFSQKFKDFSRKNGIQGLFKDSP